MTQALAWRRSAVGARHPTPTFDIVLAHMRERGGQITDAEVEALLRQHGFSLAVPKRTVASVMGKLRGRGLVGRSQRPIAGVVDQVWLLIEGAKK